MDIGTTQREPSWIFPGSARARVPGEEAATFLESLEDEDRDLFVLSHGLGLDLGTVAYATHLDTSIVSWRLRRALMASEIAGEPGELERGVAALFSEDTNGAWDPDARLDAMSVEVKSRLAARLASHAAGAAGAEARSGLGIGAVAMTLLAMIAFGAYGVISYEDPMYRGKVRMGLGQYQQARNAFRDRGNLPEARALTAVTWLAVGNYEKAFEVLDEPAAQQYLASFRPIDTGLEMLDVEPGSTALLPRGLITSQRPDFVYVGGPAGEFSVAQSRDDETVARTLQLPEQAGDGGPVTRVYPASWRLLEPGAYVWTAPGDPPNSAAFTVMSRAQRQQIQRHSWQRLSHDIPIHARTFLRGHYYLRSGLYMQAGYQFRDLVEAFPDEPYPREMLGRISAALGVDPTAFLR
ncbi:MAG: hypothetical protein ACYTCU_04605 [Planctomycetota bacterium]|jgi:hypothetical protein